MSNRPVPTPSEVRMAQTGLGIAARRAVLEAPDHTEHAVDIHAAKPIHLTDLADHAEEVGRTMDLTVAVLATSTAVHARALEAQRQDEDRPLAATQEARRDAMLTTGPDLEAFARAFTPEAIAAAETAEAEDEARAAEWTDSVGGKA